MRALFFISFVVLCQPFFSQKASFIGKWEILRHKTTAGKDTNYNCAKYNSMYLTFFVGGTYQLKILDAPGKMSWLESGKWKLNHDSTKLTFYSKAATPVQPNKNYDDVTVDVVRITKKELVFKEHMCTKDVLGVSYYIRTR